MAGGLPRLPIVIAVFLVIIIGVSLSDQTAVSVQQSDITISVTAQFIQGSSIGSSHFFVMIEATLNSGGGGPPQGGHIAAALTATLNNTAYFHKACNLDLNGHNTYAQCSITVPTAGFGTYVFSAQLSSAPDNLISTTNAYSIFVGENGNSLVVSTVTTNVQSTATAVVTSTSSARFSSSISTRQSITSSTTSSIVEQSPTTTRSTTQDSTLSSSLLPSNSTKGITDNVPPSSFSLMIVPGIIVLILGIGLFLFSTRRPH